MILQGSIERFDLGSVLQFLAHNAATGILEIRDFEEHGRIYLVKGRLEGISLPRTDDRLGVHLIKGGVLNEDQLARVLMEEMPGFEGAEGHKPLGQRLVERGFTNEGIIRQAMYRLIMARMFELAHWRTGEFAYDEPDEMPEFQIAIRGDVQELLLRTQIRIDQGERPRKQSGRQAGGSVLRVPRYRLFSLNKAQVPQEGPMRVAQDERRAGCSARALRCSPGGSRLCGSAE